MTISSAGRQRGDSLLQYDSCFATYPSRAWYSYSFFGCTSSSEVKLMVSAYTHRLVLEGVCRILRCFPWRVCQSH